MNELGLTLAWVAVQVTLVVVPALALHALASRRGPASGAWVATLGLALIAGLSVAGLIVGGRRGGGVSEGGAPMSEPIRADGTSPIGEARTTTDVLGHDRPRTIGGRGWDLSGLRLAWARFERGAAEPAARCRPWGSVLAAVALAGTVVGFVRLLAGLWAVRLCRRCGTRVDNPGMTGLLDELRGAMGCRALVELREVADLDTPATAGWRSPVLLLPGDWRAWDAVERRAVLAHELAHIVRGDYAAGLLARLAVLLNSYHPMVRWFAGRLQLQQEQAADALGARFAGGRMAYLVALSRLALKQDGRSPCWPARQFLPGRGTLIRRIAMLQDSSRTYERTASGAWRLVMTVMLLGLTVGVATLRGPARGAEGDDPDGTAAKSPAPATGAADPAIMSYVGDGMAGLVVFRPAATFRHPGMGRFATLLSDGIEAELSQLARQLKVDMARPGFIRLGCQDIEWVASGVRFGRTKNAQGDRLHSIMCGRLTVRAAAPFDWLALLRQWRFGLTEVREGGRVYYRITGPLQPLLGPAPGLTLLDDRTILFDEEKAIRTLLSRETPSRPAYLQGPDWEKAVRGLLAVAIDNHDGSLAKDYDLGRPDDAMVLPLFKDVEHWTFGIDDADALALHAVAACRSGDAGESIARAIDSLLKLARTQVELPHAEPDGEGEERLFRVAKAFLAKVRIGRAGRSLELHAEGIGTLTDLAAIVRAEGGGEGGPRVSQGEKPKPTKR